MEEYLEQTMTMGGVLEPDGRVVGGVWMGRGTQDRLAAKGNRIACYEDLMEKFGKTDRNFVKTRCGF